MVSEPPFLEIDEYHLSALKANLFVTNALSKLPIAKPTKGWHTRSYTLNGKSMTYRELVNSAKMNGYIPQLQYQIDQNDNIFGGGFGMSTPTMGFTEVKNEFAGYTEVLTPPMVTMPAELVISQDILFYRKQSCLTSSDYDFTMCTRHYRAYLSSCISLVDAFINRHTLIFNFEGKKHKALDELNKVLPIEDKLEQLLILTTGNGISSINGGVEWQHFMDLKKLRNKMIHLSAPSMGYSIHEFAEHFNLVKKGIGGLLYMIRSLQGTTTLGFIEALKTAPTVHFNEITHKGDGNHIIKRRT